MTSLFDRLRQGLARTHQSLVGAMESLAGGKPSLPASVVEDLREPLIAADVGWETTALILDGLRDRLKAGGIKEPSGLVPAVKEIILGMLSPAEGVLEPAPSVKPWVVFVAGINGSGKTTTIAKLGRRWSAQGKKVAFAAADTFRAGAIEQLRVWADRVGAGFFSGAYGADPASVIFDAVKGAMSRGDDILVVDTAGRLHTSANLMEELKKARRICAKALPGSPHEVLLVLDATIGQNALIQARSFHEALGLTGIVLTKLDSTAKGGIIVAVSRELPVPIKLIGVGEQADDLQDFHAAAFVDALFAP